MAAPFEIVGPLMPESPVVLSVPHAGRDYSMALRAALRVPVASLRPLEDRHVDTLARAVRCNETAIIQCRPRAWIDLNRAESERDPEVDEGAPRLGRAASAKVRSGLGLIPRRAVGTVSIWRRRFAAEEVALRIASDHRPYHAALSDLLSGARDRFGTAVLLDLHSMPTPPSGATLVLGDRHGRSAAARLVGRLEVVAVAAGFDTALNTPYAGGHILERHGAPRAGIHAIQLELARDCYLDDALEGPGPGFHRAVAALRRMIDALVDEALGGLAVAAE